MSLHPHPSRTDTPAVEVAMDIFDQAVLAACMIVRELQGETARATTWSRSSA
jgi:hypothetical protein